MDRNIVYTGAIPLDTDILSVQKNAMIGLSKLAAAILGVSTLVNGLACTPTSPATLTVNVAPGEIYAMANIDGTAFGSLAADTTHTILKQGISLNTVNLACPAPGTAGYSINYLIQSAYQDVDAVPVTLPYYNAANPAVAFSGPANSGTPQNTIRQGALILSAKAGIAATTGTQTTPAADSGYVGLWVVTVANGAASISAGNISAASGAPFITETLTQKISHADSVIGGFKNLKIDSIGINNYSCVITADEVILENGSNQYLTMRTVNKTVNANGTIGAPLSIMSARAASTWYYRWLWYNAANGLTATLDLSSTAPTAPTGYASTDYKALLPGACKTDASGSTYLIQLSTRDRKTSYVVLSGSNTAALPIFISGVQGNINTPTWQSVAVTGASGAAIVAPPTTKIISLVMGGGYQSSAGLAAAPNNQYGAWNSATNPPPLMLGNGTAGNYSYGNMVGDLLLESANLYFMCNASAGFLSCKGWED